MVYSWEETRSGHLEPSLDAGMTPGRLLLLVGSVALWTGLLAAPPQKPSGQPPLSPSSAPGAPSQNQASQKEKAKLACIAAKETEVAQKSPMPQGSQRGGTGEIVAEEHQPGKGGSLPAKGAGPAPPEKFICKKKPPLERPSVNNMAVTPPGGPRPAEMPQVASERDLSLGMRPQPGGGLLPAGKVPLKEKPRCVNRPKLVSKPAFPSLELFPNREAIHGGKPNTSERPASNTQHDKPTSGMWKPSSTGKLIPGTGHTTQEKPIPSEKPRGDGKPALAAGHVVHLIPTSGEKPASDSGPMAHGKPISGEKQASGEKPSSHMEHGKHPFGNKPTSSEKPEHGEKPAAEKESKPEKEVDDSKKTEDEEEDDLFDDDEEEDKDNEGGTSDISEGNKDGDDDAFNKELDYGLNKSPFNGYSYHDAWSDDDAKDANARLMEETGALPEAGDASSDRKPIFDAWGDLVGGSRPSLQA